MPEKHSRPKPPATIADGKFELGKKLGAGCFGEVYRGTNKETSGDIAIKTEECNSSAPQLAKEYDMLKTLRDPKPVQGFAECFAFRTDGGYNLLVMDLLGRSIEEMVQKCQGRFTPKTTSIIASQLLHRIEYLHAKGLVHRDIKPENFMFGIKDKVHHIYVIDFGLSKKYWDKGKHNAIKSKLSLTGTARYASINAHMGVEQSRRDDLEAIGHMFMYFLRGSVPWSGLEARTKEEKYRKIMDKKKDTPLPELCAGYPKAFENYLDYARHLDFSTKPDYDMMQDWFKQVNNEFGVTAAWQYQWFENGPPGPGGAAALVPLEDRAKIYQPDEEKPIQANEGGKKAKGGGGCLCFCGGKANVRE